MTPRSPVKRPRAFTLVEVIATIVVVSILGGAASSIVLNTMDGFVDATVRAELHTELSVGLDRIVRELRNIQLDDSASGVAPDIDAVTATSLDWDDDSRIRLVGSNLELSVGGEDPAVLVADVSEFSVRCHDEDDTALPVTMSGTSCDAVRRLALSITCTRHGVTESLRTKLFIRSTLQGAS